MTCPNCNGSAVEITSITDTHERWLCLECGQHFDGAALADRLIQ